MSSQSQNTTVNGNAAVDHGLEFTSLLVLYSVCECLTPRKIHFPMSAL